MLRKTLFAAFVVTAATSTVLGACSCDTDPVVAAPNAPASAPKAAPAVAPAAAPAAAPASAAKGVIRGMIKFEGTAPEATKVDLSPDPVCVEAHKGTDGMKTPGGVQVGAGGGLADVFVQLTTGLPADKKYEAPAEPAVIDQVGCTYVPHILGVMKKQKIEIHNSDPTLHNIHAQPKTNKEFNLAMPTKDPREVEFKKGEEAIHIKCDVHPWMSAYCFCMEHPFFAVSGADGSFSINLADLPDGEYGIKLWHETLGTQEGKVTVKDGAGSFDLAFKK